MDRNPKILKSEIEISPAPCQCCFKVEIIHNWSDGSHTVMSTSDVFKSIEKATEAGMMAIKVLKPLIEKEGPESKDFNGFVKDDGTFERVSEPDSSLH